MSKSGVKQFCSILNYLRNEDELIYNIIVDLCMSHLLKPKKNGVTLLRPVGSARKELANLAKNNPEGAVKMLHSFIILEHVENKSDLKDAPTVAGALNMEATKAKIEVDKKFIARNSHYREDGKSAPINIAIWTVDKPVVVGAKVKMSDRAARKKVTGGADLQKNRTALFEQVLKLQSINNTANSAMELLALFGNYLQTNEHPKYELFCGQLSNDTLTSLAILLRPYAAEKNCDRYLDDDLVIELARYATNRDITNIWHVREGDTEIDAKKVYESHMSNSKCEKGWLNQVDGLIDSLNNVTAITQLHNFYKECGVTDRGSPAEMFAEAELRVIMAILHDNHKDDGKYPADELKHWYKNCNLDTPYLCTYSGSKMDIGVYYSTVSFIARSDALIYYPDLSSTEKHGYKNALDSIVTGNTHINHTSQFKLPSKANVEESPTVKSMMEVPITMKKINEAREKYKGRSSDDSDGDE
jgi:hypothetical protein